MVFNSRKAHKLDAFGPAERDLRLLSSKAAEVYKHSKFDLLLAKLHVIPLWVFIIFALATLAQVAPVIVKEFDPSARGDSTRYLWWGFVVVVLILSFPMMVVVRQWRPCNPHNAKLPGALPTVDIVIPTYREELKEIVDTLVACQRVEYASNKVVVYVLDDAARDDVKRICSQMSSSGLLRYQLIYVRRPKNLGKKGGNLNSWLRRFEKTSGEFFVVLDADMQPFPDMLDILVGHYYGMPLDMQERMAYLQTPQWYRNNLQTKKWHDVYNLSEFFFYRVLQPSLSHSNCAIYVGCVALWSRRCVEAIGGFVEGYSTEDSVTGCEAIRSSIPGRKEHWVAKYVAQPIAAGVSPSTLPALMEQRLRWYHGLCQMFRHHNGYLNAKGMTFTQRVMLFVASANYISNIILYLTGLVGTLVLFGTIAFYGFTRQLDELTLWAFWAGAGVLFATFFLWTLLPGCNFAQYYFTANAMFIYTPVYIVAMLRFYFGFKFRVQDSAAEDADEKKWHPFFWMPIFTLTIVTIGAGVAAGGLAAASNEPIPIAPALTVPVWWLLWVWLHLHALHGILGFKYSDEKFYEKEASGMLSDGHIQKRISEHQQSVRSSRSSSRYSSRRSSRQTSRAGSPLDSDDESSDYQVGLTGDPNDPSYGLGDSDSMDNSLLSAVIEKLNVISARRSAVDDHMEAKKQQWSREGKKLPSGSVQNEPFFDKKLLGRVSSHHHADAYLSKTSIAATQGGLVPQQAVERSEFEEDGASRMTRGATRYDGEVSTDVESDGEASSTYSASSSYSDSDMEQVYAGKASSSSDGDSRGLEEYL